MFGYSTQDHTAPYSQAPPLTLQSQLNSSQLPTCLTNQTAPDNYTTSPAMKNISCVCLDLSSQPSAHPSKPSDPLSPPGYTDPTCVLSVYILLVYKCAHLIRYINSLYRCFSKFWYSTYFSWCLKRVLKDPNTQPFAQVPSDIEIALLRSVLWV